MALACEFIVIIIGNTFLHRNLNHFLLNDDFFCLADLTFVLYDHSRCLAIPAFHLGMLVHTRTKLDHFLDDSFAFTAWAFLDIFTSLPVTGRAHSIPFVSEFPHPPVVALF